MRTLLLLAFLAILAQGCQTADAPQTITYPGLDLTRFQSSMDKFAAQDSINGIPEGGIVFTGSSSIRFWKTLEQDMAPFPVLNRGFGGSTIPEMDQYGDQLIYQYQPELVVVYCGENDAWMDSVSTDQVLDAFKAFARNFDQHLPESEMLYISMKPSPSRVSKWEKFQDGNAKIKSFIEDETDYHFIDIGSTLLTADGQQDSTLFVDDMLHMNEAGYERWKAIVKPLLYQYYNADKLDYDLLYGDFFEAVQLGAVYPDSKTFTDCTPKFAADVILEAYAEQKELPDFNLKTFVEANFDPPPLHSTDFKSIEGRSVEDHINALWPILTREPDPGKPGGSLIPLPHPYVVPGGRFGEIYYWDSYFTILGLQVAGKDALVEDMVDNFAYLIDNVGFIPNGNRSYFMGRSQPPFFSLMVRVLAQMKPNEDIIVKYLPQLEKEYAFWMDGSENEATTTSAHRRVVKLEDGTILNRYWDDRAAPRAESYKEDVHLAEETGREPVQLYQDLRAACESGWDFSSRWFEDGKSLGTIQTTQILPVDLNALLYHLEYLIAQGAKSAGDGEKMAKYGELAEARKQAIQTLFWNEQEGYFMDWNFKSQQHMASRTLAGMYPLFLDVSKPDQASKAARIIERDFLKDGGVVTTLAQDAGQQWDYPNGWAPLQWVTIAGLRKYGETELAEEVRRRWITLNQRVYENTGKMVEKYNVIDMTLLAGGGEYDLQDGFGWSNGILLRLLSEN